MNESYTANHKLWKKVLSVFLSLIMAFGTFVSITFGNLFLSDYVNIKTAFASELSPVPVFYRHGELVGLYKVNYTNAEKIQYKVGENGEWTDYSVPFSIPAFQTTRVYARIGDNGDIAYKDFSTTNKALGVYEERNTDFNFSYNNVTFEYSRIYNSADEKWFDSIDSVLSISGNLAVVTLPDSTIYNLIKTDTDKFVDELYDYILEKQSNKYIFHFENYDYYFSLSSGCYYLSEIKDSFSNTLTLNRNVDLVDYTISDETGRSFSMVETYDLWDQFAYIRDITDPNGNEINYLMDINSYDYTSVTDQAGVCLGEYEYTNGKLSKSNGNTVEYYDNGRLKKITYQNGSWIQYTYTDSEKVYTTLTSSGATTRTVYNDAFMPVEYTDEYGTKTTYTYDNHYRVLTESCGDNTTTYTYDAKGNILSYVTGNAENNTYFTYDSNGNIIREQSGNNYTYYTYDGHKNVLVYATLKENYSGEIPALYDSSLTCFDTICYTYDNKGRISREQDSSGTVTDYEYDNRGNVTRETYSVTKDGETTTTVTTYTYDELGNVLTTSRDGDTSSYIYDNAGRTLLANENGDCTRTLYDTLGRTVQEISPEDYDSEKDGLPSANTYADETAGHTYTYAENGNLTSETNRLGITTDYLYNDVGAKIRESFDIYEFNYTDHGEISNVIIAGNTYATYNYDENLLESIEYGNDQTVFYEYNDFGQVTSQKYRDNDNAPTETQYEYTYTEDAEDIDDSVLTSKIDYRNNQITEYDGNTVTISNFEIVDGEISVTELYYSYEESEDIAEEDSSEASPQYLNQSFADTSFNTTFNEDCDVFTKDNEEICRYNYQYDASGELLSTSITNTVDGEDNTILNTTYEYNEKGYITKMTNTFANGEIVSTYSYDDLGRLIEYHPDESSVAYYVYDSKGQLVREDYQFGLASATVTYKYDSRGNIETIKQYPFTRGDITQAPEETENLDFEYDDGIWLDVLTEIGDNPLLYDSQGNLINLTDCDVNWTNGRQLSSYSYTNEDGVTEDIIKYNYDENGIRISKEYDGITTYYTTIDGRITSQYEIDENGTKQNEMIFMYNSLNEIIGVQYEGYNYYYLKNAMGDVIGFIDELESHLTIYYYNAWGNHTSGSTISFSSAENSSLSHKLDEINPMRYRGYYLDSELNFFYLQSRYYASDWCRFINADLPEYAQMQKDLNAGINLFAYCNNDPVNFLDTDGRITVSLANKKIGNLVVRFARNIISTWSVSASVKSKEFVMFSALGVQLYVGVSVSTSLTAMKNNVSTSNGHINVSSKCSISCGNNKVTFSASTSFNGYTIKGAVTLGTTAIAYGLSLISQYFYSSNSACYFAIDFGLRISHWTTAAATVVASAVCVAIPYVAPAVGKIYTSALSSIYSYKSFIIGLSTAASAGLSFANAFS